jgi:hypothetical protein
MGKIRTTTFAPTLPGTPQGPGAGEIIGQGIQEFGQAVEQAGETVTRAVTQRKNMAASKSAAEAQQELQEQWSQTLREADPEDDEVHTRFMEEVLKPRLAKLKQDTRFLPDVAAHIERLNLGITTQFASKTFEDIAELQSVQAGADFDTAVNLASEISFKDPDAFDGQVDLLEASVQAFIQGGGSSQAAIAMRVEGIQKIAMSAATGLIDQDPLAAVEELAAGAFGDALDTADRASLTKYAKNVQDSRDQLVAVGYREKKSWGCRTETNSARVRRSPSPLNLGTRGPRSYGPT